MTIESFELQSSEESNEKMYDSRLENLWNKYNFPHNPPKKGSKAEQRLHKTCLDYASHIDVIDKTQNISLLKQYDADRRRLHNEIALMVVSKQRTGMSKTDAEHIGSFAYEYARGFTLDEMQELKSYSN